MKIFTLPLTLFIALVGHNIGWAQDEVDSAPPEQTPETTETPSEVIEGDLQDVIDAVDDVLTYGPIIGPVINLLTPKPAY